MLLAVEGPTCSGKSTLIEQLAERVPGAKLLHCSKPRGNTRLDVLQEYVLDHEGYNPEKDRLIFDRLHMGEVTYAPIYRPESNKDGFGLLGRAGWRWVELFLASRGAAVAMLTADNTTLISRFTERGDDHVTNPDDLVGVSALYEVARRESINVCAIHNTSVGETTADKYASFIDTYLQDAERRTEMSQRLIGEFPNYIGSLMPSVILLGDARNIGEKHGELTQLPFLPIEGNSGDYLLSALPDQFWRSVGIVNANEIGDLGDLWDMTGRPKMVALGVNAARALEMAGFVDDFPRLPHPQYVRRFAHASKRDYGKAIQEAALTGEVTDTWTR